MLPDLEISVSDSIATREAVGVVVSPIVLVGIATQLRLTSVAPEWHPHAQPNHEPLLTIDGVSISAVVAMWALAALMRRRIGR
jgi:uncharacterized protein (TIGR03382 family)